MRTAAQVPVSSGKRATTHQRSPLLRGLRILEILEGRALTVSEIARQLEVNRSTAQRLLKELECAGYVGRDPESRKYSADLQRRVVQQRVARTGVAGNDDVAGEWGEALEQILREVRDATGECTMFAVPAKDRMLYAAFYPTDHPVGVQESIGSSRPMHASAVGKAYLASLGLGALDVVLGRLNYSSGTDVAAKGPFQLRDMLLEVRRQGYAVDHDETFGGLSCVATPVLVNGTILVGAAGITGPTHRVSAERAEEYGELLVQRASNLMLA